MSSDDSLNSAVSSFSEESTHHDVALNADLSPALQQEAAALKKAMADAAAHADANAGDAKKGKKEEDEKDQVLPPVRVFFFCFSFFAFFAELVQVGYFALYRYATGMERGGLALAFIASIGIGIVQPLFMIMCAILFPNID